MRYDLCEGAITLFYVDLFFFFFLDLFCLCTLYVVTYFFFSSIITVFVYGVGLFVCVCGLAWCVHCSACYTVLVHGSCGCSSS